MGSDSLRLIHLHRRLQHTNQTILLKEAPEQRRIPKVGFSASTTKGSTDATFMEKAGEVNIGKFTTFEFLLVTALSNKFKGDSHQTKLSTNISVWCKHWLSRWTPHCQLISRPKKTGQNWLKQQSVHRAKQTSNTTTIVYKHSCVMAIQGMHVHRSQVHIYCRRHLTFLLPFDQNPEAAWTLCTSSMRSFGSTVWYFLVKS